MTDLPYFREAGRETGTGPGVVCLHSNASTSGQWRSTMEVLAPHFHVLAPDTYGAGKGTPWPADRTIMLRDEVERLAPVFDRAGDPFAIVGHSYGAAIALVAALMMPTRVRCLALYEPTLFALLDAEVPRTHDADGIRGAVAGAKAALDAGDLHRAAECFIDFWMEPGAWARTPESRKDGIAGSMTSVAGWGHALFAEPTPLAAFTELNIPVLLMKGARSPASSLGVARLLAPALPQVEVAELDGLGHMGPLTHPERVNELVLRFLERTHPSSTRA